jgi:phosphoribosylformylglycinamidine synthase II
MKRVEIIPHYAKRQLQMEKRLKDLGFDCRCEKWSSFLLEAVSGKMPSDDLISSMLSDEHKENIYFSENQEVHDAPDYLVEISFLPGVTDNIARSCSDLFALEDFAIDCYSSTLYAMYGESLSKNGDALEVVEEVLGKDIYNPLIERLTILKSQTKVYQERFNDLSAPIVNIDNSKEAYVVNLDLDDDKLIQLSQERCLALELNEMTIIKNYFSSDEVRLKRKEVGLGEITDVELEVLAQTWSEHCKHKIFAADIEYIDEVKGEKRSIESLYKSYIKKATKDIDSDFLISVFSDNAGIVRFDNQVDICIKAETHNSPSALDPYGGALTGILGVNRDIMGCGLGAKPVANTNVFCVGPQNLEEKIGTEYMPQGLMSPPDILRGIHAGVRDGGNKSGIPTVNGAMFFDENYAGKPLVFCGTVGVMPPKLADGRDSSEKGAKDGDLVYVVGGRVGADGIHGATFSSMDLNKDSPATAVQIGDPITQKRVLDFLLEARDQCLFTCVTDNGAGGISSSIGEMATLTNGGSIDLAKHPVKYQGLSPWEIMISESQERMTFAVDPKHAGSFEELAKKRHVDASCLGHFNESGYLSIYYEASLVGFLPMDFLHDGLPVMKLTARFSDNSKGSQDSWLPEKNSLIIKEPSSLKEKLLLLLARENIASKRPWVEQYDHEVQGSTLAKPFVGKEQRSPGNCGIITLDCVGGEENSALAIGCGLSPRWSAYDSYTMAKMSVDEAIRNIISQGANPDKICLLDNFCWPDPIESEKTPDGAYKLAQLVQCCEGLYDICLDYKTPLVSGKDSMKNDFRGVNAHGQDLTISIKPTLLVTAMGHVDQRFTCDSTLKDVAAEIFVIGQDQRTMMASEFEACFGSSYSETPKIDFDDCFKTYRSVYELIREHTLLSCHDISEGGLLTTLSEMTFDTPLEVSIDLPIGDIDRLCFGEGPGQFIISCKTDLSGSLKNTLEKSEIPYFRLGSSKPAEEGTISVQQNSNNLLAVTTHDLISSWERKWF